MLYGRVARWQNNAAFRLGRLFASDLPKGIASIMQATAPVSIADLAHLAGVDVASIRSYEEMGLLPKPRRGRGRPGDCAYHQEHLDRLAFVRRALELGFSLGAIAELAGARGGLRTCNDVYRIAERQLVDIRDRIADLQRKEANLSELIAACPAKGPGRDCVILNTLHQPASPNESCCRS
jgi:MerR family transcriptional regulator, mercuric resistance operon regulatory protein